MGGVSCCTVRPIDRNRSLSFNWRDEEVVSPTFSQEEKLTKEWQIVANSISSEELGRLEALRTAVADLHNHPACRRQSFSRQAQTLLRFLRGRDGSVEKAQRMFKESMNWRYRFGIDRKVALWREEVAEGTSNRVRLLATYGTDADVSLDKSGVPVWLMRPSVGDPAGLLREIGEETLLVDSLSKMEAIHEHIRQAMFREEKVVRGCVQIVDVGDYGKFGVPNWWARMMNLYWVGKKVFQTFEANYPETARKIFIIRMGSVGTKMYQWVTPLVPKRTQEKMRIFGFDADTWKKELCSELQEGYSIPNFLMCNSSGSFAIARPPGGIVPTGGKISDDDISRQKRSESEVLAEIQGRPAIGKIQDMYSQENAIHDLKCDGRPYMKCAILIRILIICLVTAIGTVNAMSLFSFASPEHWIV